MKILLTGASSFTGLWFARALSKRGATVVAPIRGRLGGYEGVRARRVAELANIAEIVEGCTFGSVSFLSLVRQRPFDVLCHHAAQVANYRSPDFDAAAALAVNTLNFPAVLQVLRERGVRALIATGSVFEQDEGIGELPLRAFSPYGLSKGLTWQVVRFWGEALGIPVGKFVIPNPFGPFEEPRFCSYLIDQWWAGKTAEVRTPLYLRDNIHVDLLALAYASFVHQVVETGQSARTGPSGYRETQGAFAERFAAEMRPRLGLECRLALTEQAGFAEPLVRLNGDPLTSTAALEWDEVAAWDGLADYHRHCRRP